VTDVDHEDNAGQVREWQAAMDQALTFSQPLADLVLSERASMKKILALAAYGAGLEAFRGVRSEIGDAPSTQ
jgi:hypothetical protein